MDWSLVVGVVGVVISAATLWFVLLDRAERKRSVTRVTWDFQTASTMHEKRNGQSEHIATVLRLANNGGSTGHIIASSLIGAKVIGTDNPLVPNAMLPGTRHDFKIEPTDTSKVWVLLVYTDSSDMRFVRVSWMPAEGIGELSDVFYRQWRAVPKGWKGRRHARRATEPVGPSGVPLRITKQLSDDEWKTFLRSAAAAALDGQGNKIHS